MVNRRALFAALAALPALPRPTTSTQLPRKVIVATVVQPFWVPYPGLEKRLNELTAIIDRMAAESHRRYGRGPDLAILPEAAITGEAGPNALSQAVPFPGPVANAFTRSARRHNTHIVVPTYLRDDAQCSNAAILLDRKGALLGTYKKNHLVVSADGKSMEGGSIPGKEQPVFHCDFGKLGIQICYDMEFDRGWQELANKGAELIAWPTQSPQTSQPAARAMQHRCHIVSSTWRNNASVFEPTGKIIAQAKQPGEVLVQEIDLSYAILPWSSKLKNGKALREMYGEKVGFRYYEDEDLGLFWSNDNATPIRRMVDALGVLEAEEDLARVRAVYGKAGVPGY